MVVVGGGGHGLATAYHLAADHGITDVAVLEKGWLAGGNMARNTTIIRSNYLWDESAGIYEHALKLWETLEERLGTQVMFDQRGVLNLAHSLATSARPSAGSTPTSSTASTRSGSPPPRSASSRRCSTCPTGPPPGARGDVPAARRDREARLRRLGLRPRRPRPRRRPGLRLRGAGLRHRRRPGHLDPHQPAATSRRAPWCCARRVTRRCSPPSWACGSRCRATRSRRWSPSCSSRCWTPS